MKKKDQKEKNLKEENQKEIKQKEGKQPTGRRIVNILIALLFIVGLGLLIYPTASNQWNTFLQQRRISTYTSYVKEATEEDFENEWSLARQYNESLGGTSIYREVFDGEETDLEDTEYWKVLNVTGDGIMGYLSIPKINLKLAIYHGTGEDVLRTGVGHLATSQLPIGGESNHAVLAAHRGLPSARLFTDIDQLEVGDYFYIYILDKAMAYQVDQILPMVDKDDYETLAEALSTVEGEDYVTLFTCTPYGVNSHRLLVRGTRVEYVEEEEPTPAQAVLQAIQDYYMLYLLLGLAVTALGIFLIRFFVYRPKRKKSAEKTPEKPE